MEGGRGTALSQGQGPELKLAAAALGVGSHTPLSPKDC